MNTVFFNHYKTLLDQFNGIQPFFQYLYLPIDNLRDVKHAEDEASLRNMKNK